MKTPFVNFNAQARRLGTIAICLLATAISAKAETTLEKARRTGTLVVGTDGSAPLATVGDDGSLKGQALVTLQQALAPLGIKKIEAVKMDFTGLIPALNASRIDAIAAGLVIRAARCGQVAFGDPDFTLREIMLVRKGNPLNLHSYEDVAANKSAIYGAMTGAAFLEHATRANIPKDRILLFPDISGALIGIRTGRVNAAGLTTTFFRGALDAANDPSLSDFIEIATPFVAPRNSEGKETTAYTAIGFRKADSDLVAAYNQNLKALRQSGDLRKIYAETKAGGEEALPPPDLTATQICASF